MSVHVTNRTGGSNTWGTPREFARGVRASLGLRPFTLDLAAVPSTALAPTHFGPGGVEADALAAAWATGVKTPHRRGPMWLNPPYSRTCLSCADRVWKGKAWPADQRCSAKGHKSSTIKDWMARAAHFGRKTERDASLLVLVPARVDTEWFHDHVFGVASRLFFVRGRLRFLTEGPDGLAPYKDPAAFPVMLIQYAGKVARTQIGAMTPTGAIVGQMQLPMLGGLQ
jgi:hypothetical protein